MAINTFYDIAGKNVCLSCATVGIGGTPEKARFTAPNGAGVDFVINGLFYHKADADDVWTMSGTTVPVSSMCLFLLCLNSSGTGSIVQGETVLTADVENGNTVVSFPAVPADKCAVGAVLVETNSSVPYVPGVSSLALAGVTDTYLNFPVPPNKGLGSDYCV